MPPDLLPPDDPREWLTRAAGNLRIARSRLPGVELAELCFNAHQAAEKAIKAARVLSDITPARSHDLEELRNALPDGWRVKRRPVHLTRLSGYGVAIRYPDDVTPITPLQSGTAVRQAMAVVRIIREDFERRGISTAGLEPR